MSKLILNTRSFDDKGQMNKSDFDQMMEEIDQKLTDEGVPIYSRPLHAVRDVSERLHVEIIFAPECSTANLGHYDELTLAAHINNWYKIRYGDRLKVHLGPGSVALLIRGVPWKMVFPRIYGKVTFNCNPDLAKYRGAPRIATGLQELSYSVLCCIEDFSAGLARTLTQNERDEILQFFMNSLEVLHSIENISSKPYVNEASADLQLAVALIMAKRPQYGLSKWSSLQFVEKLLKSFLELKKTSIPKHHNLQKIFRAAEAFGLVLPNAAQLPLVQCVAGVRYGEVQVTLSEAISAHHASLTLAGDLAGQIKGA